MTNISKEPDNILPRELIDSISARFPSDQITIVFSLAKLSDVECYPPVRYELDWYVTSEFNELRRHYATAISGP